MTTFTWTITALDCLPLADGVVNYAVVAHWTCAGTDGTYNASAYSTCSFPAPTGPADQYTPYDQLTQDQVLGWCWTNGVDKDATEAAVQQMLDNQINPPVVTPPLPWAAA
jgi:hypothetical protein